MSGSTTVRPPKMETIEKWPVLSNAEEILISKWWSSYYIVFVAYETCNTRSEVPMAFKTEGLIGEREKFWQGL